MEDRDESRQNAELRQAFLRHLPRRMDAARRRGLQLARDGWDINALILLQRELRAMATACQRFARPDIQARLAATEREIAPCVAQHELPDGERGARVVAQLEALAPIVEQLDAPPPVPSAAGDAEAGFQVETTPPTEFVARYARPMPIASIAEPESDAPPVDAQGAAEAPEIAFEPAPGFPDHDAPTPRLPEPAATAAAPVPAATQVVILHLTDGNALAAELDLRIESEGWQIELLDDVDQLRQRLKAGASLVIVDPAHLGIIDGIGQTVREARGHGISANLLLMVLSDDANVGARLRAMRAGADSFIGLPTPAPDIVGRIRELLDAEGESPYRVLIIEDDRSQAMFAESILKKSGMATCVVMDPLAALAALETFEPELILMDLYMPNCDGMELTALIREREQFAATPIVFLSGEHDADKRFDALSAGGDDYLEKPIRPKYLISAVTNRVRRSRQLNRKVRARNPRDAASGLYERGYTVARIAEALAADEEHTNLGGVLFVIIDGAQAIRERIGLSAFDTLMLQAGTLLGASVAATDHASRYGDTSFVIHSPGHPEHELVRFGEDLRAIFAGHVFEVGDKSLSLAIAVGVAPFALGWPDANAIVNAAERACAQARGERERKVRVYEPQLGIYANDPRETLLQEIRQALQHDRFHLVFQPVVSLKGESEEKFQVLLRLKTPDGREHTASELLPLVASARLTDALDRWVLSRCVATLAERDRVDRPLKLFVNQSIEAVHDRERASWLEGELRSLHVDGSSLVLELRFADVRANLKASAAFFEAVRALGVRIGLAGFEGDEVSVQALSHVKVDFVKPAQHYLAPEAQAELKQVIQVAKDHGLLVLAPQIEDARTAAALWNIGIDYVQGNFVQQASTELEYDFRASAG